MPNGISILVPLGTVFANPVTYINVSPSKRILIHTTDAVVVHYGCKFYGFATIAFKF